MDMPINVVEWEVFVPEQFRADRFGGNVIDADLMPIAITSGRGGGIGSGPAAGLAVAATIRRFPSGPHRLRTDSR